MTTWIFQDNPDRFDISGYLASAGERIAWLVNQSRNQIKPGDQVFLWRALGSGKHGLAGIVAECLVDSPVMQMTDDPASVRLWREPYDPRPRHRVWLKVVRLLERAAILERGIIANTLPFKLPFGTIYSTNITPDRETGVAR
jgi:hypothetical protein